MHKINGLAAAAALSILTATACGGGGDASGLPTLVDSPSAAAAQNTEPEESEASEAGSNVASARPDADSPQADADSVPAASAVSRQGPADPQSVAAAPSETAGAEPGEATDASGAAASSGGRPAEDMTDEERLLEFARCMRDNGVDFPDPVVDADGGVTFGVRPGAGNASGLAAIGRDPDLPRALEACDALREALAFGPGRNGFDTTELQDQLLVFAQCMRDNGVDMGDPDLRDFLPGPAGRADGAEPGGPFAGVDFDDPEVREFIEVCRDQALLPEPGAGARRP